MMCCGRKRPLDMAFFSPLDMSGGGGVASNRIGCAAPHRSWQAGSESASEARLGNTAKSVDQPVSVRGDEQDQKKKDAFARINRMVSFRLQRRAAKLLPDERVGLCRWAVRSRDAGVTVQLTEYASGGTRASYAGLQTCGSVWLCPCCGRRISETRRSELNTALAWAKGEGLQPVMITLTARHGIRDQLAGQLDAMKRAKQRLRQRREWRAIKDRIAGTVTATEVTHGGHGWHTHFHEIVLVEAGDEAEAIAVLAGLDRVWRSCLLGVGLSGGRAAWQVQGAAAAGQYVGKWGAGEEMTLTSAKRARGKGRTPLQLLADADAGDDQAAQLWRTYGTAFKGRRQLVWSPGLKTRAGIGDTSDAEAAEDEQQEDAQTVSQVLRIEHQFWVGTQRWLGARHRRGRVLDAAETGGATAADAVVRDGKPDERREDAIGVIDDSAPISDWMEQLKDKKAGIKDTPPDVVPPPLNQAEFDAAVDDLMSDDDDTGPDAASPLGAQKPSLGEGIGGKVEDRAGVAEEPPADE